MCFFHIDAQAVDFKNLVFVFHDIKSEHVRKPAASSAFYTDPQSMAFWNKLLLHDTTQLRQRIRGNGYRCGSDWFLLYGLHSDRKDTYIAQTRAGTVYRTPFSRRATHYLAPMNVHLLDINAWILLLTVIAALIVFGLIYFLIQFYFNNQLKLKLMEARGNNTSSSAPLKLQAYERLMLFCERVSIPSLLLRLQSSEMSARDLKSALVLTIQQEFEYNLSQQLYVSEKLWQIIRLAKNQLIEIVTHVGNTLPAKASGEEFSKQLIMFIESQKKDPIETAKSAIKKEAALLL